MPTRTARTAWTGTLEQGVGKVELTSSRIGTYEVSFPRRAADEAGGYTSPEELIAAAHSACYAMQLSALIGMAGGTPQALDVQADVSLGPDPAGGFHLTGIKLTVRGEDLESDTRIRRPSGCIRFEYQIEGTVCTAPDSPDVNGLSAGNRRNVEILSTFEVLLDRVGCHREGSASKTLAAVTDVARAILIPRNRDRHRAASIGHDIGGVSGVVVQGHIRSERRGHRDRFGVVWIVVQTHQQIRRT